MINMILDDASDKKKKAIGLEDLERPFEFIG